MLRLATVYRNSHINLLRSFPIFKQYILIQYYRNIIYNSPFLPYFFFDFNTALLDIKCMSMFKCFETLQNTDLFSEINPPFVHFKFRCTVWIPKILLIFLPGKRRQKKSEKILEYFLKIVFYAPP